MLKKKNKQENNQKLDRFFSFFLSLRAFRIREKNS